jgi:ATPase subunit of ABC transporter with duplicated ATPase domains
MKIVIVAVIAALVLVVVVFALAVRIIRQYERGVVFRFGRLLAAREPGFRLIIPLVDVLHRVSLRAVEGVKFRIRHGEICALPGPNGVGETTTVEILEAHRRRTSPGAWTGRLAPVHALVWLAVA